MAQFSDFQLPPSLLQAVADLKFTTPTEIQTRTMAPALEGRDLVACAQTGCGKTAAFALPMLTRLLQTPDTNALILAPTRELAQQIATVMAELSRHTRGLPITLLIGGADMGRQIQSLNKRPRILVATPGRLVDHIRRRSVSLKTVKILVLDEADRMLDMGFQRQVETILGQIPRERQTLLFSATMPPTVRRLAERYMKNPLSIEVGPPSQPVSAIKQTGIVTTMSTKNDMLLDELNARKGSILIFTRTKHRTDRLSKYLDEYGYQVSRIHGGRSQGQRNAALNGFREGKFRILVATDVAARGIDVPQIAHVINYDLPMFDEDYVHRIGRTARAGATGEAITFLLPEDRNMWQKLVRKYKIGGGNYPQGGNQNDKRKMARLGSSKMETRNSRHSLEKLVAK
jgi:superfamily II DNA/RNA helicase